MKTLVEEIGGREVLREEWIRTSQISEAFQALHRDKENFSTLSHERCREYQNVTHLQRTRPIHKETGLKTFIEGISDSDVEDFREQTAQEAESHAYSLRNEGI